MKAKVIRKEQCPVCALKGLDKSKNNLAVYEDGGKFCFGACNRAISLSESYKAKLELIKEFECKELVFPVTNFTKEHWDVLKEKLTTDPKGYRGLKKSTCEIYRVFHEIDAVSNKVKKQYYPISKDNKFSGIKIRQEPKSFYAEGTNDAQCDLFGQALFTQSTSKWIIYVEGELDALSAFQMLEAQRKSDFASIPVVSGTVGAGGSVNQLKNNYTFLDRFEKIILIPDQDEAGQAAIERIAQSLPKDKLYIADLPAKDANEMLMAGREKEFVTAVLWKHRHYTPAGIFGSDTIYEKILEKALVPKVAFPKFLDKLNYITGGGVQVGTINTISAGCYPPDTEFFNGVEWKHISNYQKGDLVLQYDKDTGKAFLKEPKEFITLPVDQFYEIKNNRISFITSEEHKHLINSENGVLSVLTTKELLKKHENNTRGNKAKLVNSFNYEGFGIELIDDYIRLKIAVFADGSFNMKRKSNTVRINIKKDRKKERLRQLLSNLSIPYKEVVKDSGYSVFSFKMDNKDKHFPSTWYQCTKQQFETIKDEVVHWDGSVVDRSNTGRKYSWSYSTLSKSDADFIQFVLTSLGFSSTMYLDKRNKYKNKEKTAYSVRLNSSLGIGISKDTSKNNTTTIEKYEAGDKMYCFVTESGFFPVRQNNNIIVSGNSGSGKSTLINQMVLDWINGRTANVGIVSLEADRADYGENLLSAHIKQKLHLIDSPEAKFNLIASEAVKDAAVKLFTNDDGTPSFYIIDERGDYNALQSKIEELIISCECNVVVIDVLSDVFDTLSIDEQAKFMGWQKAICKRYGTIFFNIMHTRKPASNQKSASQGAVMTEESMMGSGTSYRSSSMIIMLARDKTAEDEVLRNMMEVHVTKNRQTGVTGNIMQLAYNLAAHQLEDASHIFEQLKEKKKEDDKPINRF